MTWVTELENEHALLEHDYLHMESLMPDEVSFALRDKKPRLNCTMSSVNEILKDDFCDTEL